ncbi:MAG: DUF167 domain-containing protein [Nanoarchaeota archaeon]|nr:DUF167 domain-containing protein [Nanoarchaeota archaeon]MBU4086946.1 DUF167 domain-containing protein [Nanoarchaeota archaeon]
MIINIRVRTNQNENRVVRNGDLSYAVDLKSLPENNKANIELINTLSKYFKISVREIRIKRGLTSKNKIIEIKNN